MMMLSTHRIIVFCCFLLTVSSSTEAQVRNQPGDDGTLRLILGVFNPSCASEYWDQSFEVFTGSASDFDDLEFMVDDLWPLSDNAALMFGIGWYEGATTQAYHDWIDPAGQQIRHKTSLRTIEGSIGLAWLFGDRQAPVRPYVAIGGGYLWWKLTERGQFIDFTDPDQPIFDANYSSSSGTFSLYGVLGMEIRFGDSWSAVVQGRYRDANDELGSSLSGLGNLDLSGYSYGAGLAFHF